MVVKCRVSPSPPCRNWPDEPIDLVQVNFDQTGTDPITSEPAICYPSSYCVLRYVELLGGDFCRNQPTFVLDHETTVPTGHVPILKGDHTLANKCLSSSNVENAILENVQYRHPPLIGCCGSPYHGVVSPTALLAGSASAGKLPLVAPPRGRLLT